MIVTKLARKMEAWRFGFDVIPNTVAFWLISLPNGGAVVVSPRAGTAHGPGSKAGVVIDRGWWIIRAETGCLYAVSDAEFHKKYRIEDERTPPASAPVTVHHCWPAQPSTLTH